MVARKITVLERQSVWDIALQEYGNSDGLFLLMKDNPSLQVSSVLVAGQKLHVRSAPLDEQVVKAYKEASHKPAGLMVRELIQNNYELTDMGGWSGNINPDFEAFNFWNHLEKNGRHPIPGLVAGRSYLVSIHLMEIWGVTVGTEKIAVELGKTSDGSDGTMEVGSRKEISTVGRHEFILSADDAGEYLFVHAEGGLDGRFKDVSVIEIT